MLLGWVCLVSALATTPVNPTRETDYTLVLICMAASGVLIGIAKLIVQINDLLNQRHTER